MNTTRADRQGAGPPSLAMAPWGNHPGHPAEIFETATPIQTGKIEEFPLVLVSVDFWQPLIDFIRDRLLANETVSPHDPSCLVLTESTADVLECTRERAMRQYHLTCSSRFERRQRSSP